MLLAVTISGLLKWHFDVIIQQIKLNIKFHDSLIKFWKYMFPQLVKSGA